MDQPCHSLASPGSTHQANTDIDDGPIAPKHGSHDRKTKVTASIHIEM
jgi:hypothetical protein